MHAVVNLSNIEIIDNKFLESGHTQMECDSVHPAIEFAKKKTEIYIPSQCTTIIRMARRKNPYYVVPLQYENIYDFKEVTKSTLKYSSSLLRRLVVSIPFLSTSTTLIFLKSSFKFMFKQYMFSIILGKSQPFDISLAKQAISLAKKKIC
jgi:hypothetical protein